MKYNGTMTRIQASDLPRVATGCYLDKPCVYRAEGICDSPWINKGNSDSACHKMSNKAIYEKLEIL